MHTKNYAFLLCIFFMQNLFSQTSPFIHVDQFGYLVNADKVAVISDPQIGFNATSSFTPSAIVELRDANTNAVVFSAAPTIWNNGNTHNQSGDKGWWFDFSGFTTPGTYYVYDPGNAESSAAFDINNNVYTEVLKAVGRMFYYNRCGMAKVVPYAETGWTDAASFAQDATCKYIYDPNNSSLEKDLSGGWFDAGDYNKYVPFTGPTLHNMLWAYQESSNAFTDNWNIPESGNGIPDILDEIKWELDWLLKMVNSNGSVIIKMGSQNYAENTAAPPSANGDPRFYGPTCTSASISAAAALAHAAKAFESFPPLSAYAQTLEDKAIDCWDYVLPFITNNTLETDCDDGSIVAGDADKSVAEQKEEALAAAIYLFDLTGNSDYNQYVIDHINDAGVIGSDDWSGYDLNIADALLLYTTLSGNDSNTSSDIINSISTSVNNNWNNYYGFNDLDLYRAFTPDWTFHWGSNKSKADHGTLNQLLINYNINSGNMASYEQKVAEQIHYFHGVNPLGIVYLSNMYGLGAEHSVNEIYHTWFNDGTNWDNAETSLYGPAPGYVPGGPNQNFSGPGSLIPPHGQPAQKSYLDWNTGFPENSWEITEPAIYYQASFLRLLATSNADIPLPVEWLGNPRAEVLYGDVHIYWTTSAEWYNEKFEIEHSLDGKSFSKIGTVKGYDNSTVTSRYIFVDRHAPQGLNYYRIKQMDFDGKFQYSAIMPVQVAEVTAFELYPNPAKDNLFIRGDLSDYRVAVFDSKGIKQYAFEFTGNSTALDLSDLPEGVYVLQILNLRANAIAVMRFVKLE